MATNNVVRGTRQSLYEAFSIGEVKPNQEGRGGATTAVAQPLHYQEELENTPIEVLCSVPVHRTPYLFKIHIVAQADGRPWFQSISWRRLMAGPGFQSI